VCAAVSTLDRRAACFPDHVARIDRGLDAGDERVFLGGEEVGGVGRFADDRCLAFGHRQRKSAAVDAGEDRAAVGAGLIGGAGCVGGFHHRHLRGEGGLRFGRSEREEVRCETGDFGTGGGGGSGACFLRETGHAAEEERNRFGAVVAET